MGKELFQLPFQAHTRDLQSHDCCWFCFNLFLLSPDLDHHFVMQGDPLCKGTGFSKGSSSTFFMFY